MKCECNENSNNVYCDLCKEGKLVEISAEILKKIPNNIYLRKDVADVLQKKLYLDNKLKKNLITAAASLINANDILKTLSYKKNATNIFQEYPNMGTYYEIEKWDENGLPIFSKSPSPAKYLNKPISLSKLLILIKNLLNNRIINFASNKGIISSILNWTGIEYHHLIGCKNKNKMNECI